MKAGLRAIQVPKGESRGRRCRYRTPEKHSPPSAMAGFLLQPCELRLKLQSSNGIAVLLAADAGFDDHSQEN